MIDTSSDPNIEVTVHWNLKNGAKVDLDATVVIINEKGSIVDAVYYNKLKSDCKSIVHSGDKGYENSDSH